MSAAREYSSVLHPVKNCATGSWTDAAFNSKEFIEKGSNFTIQNNPVHFICWPFITWTIHSLSYLFSLAPVFPSLIHIFLKFAQLTPSSWLLRSPAVCSSQSCSLSWNSKKPSTIWALTFVSGLNSSYSLSCIPCSGQIGYLLFPEHNQTPHLELPPSYTYCFYPLLSTSIHS